MKQSLQLKFSQSLALTPQLQQSIRLLQLSSQELNQELETILQENPLLERTDKNDDGSENVSQFTSTDFTTKDSISTSSTTQKNEDEPSDHLDQVSLSDDYFGGATSHRWDETGGQDDDSDYTFQEAVTPLTKMVIWNNHLMSWQSYFLPNMK